MAGDDNFSFDTVAVLVAVLQQKGVSLGMNDYRLMSQLDGSRGASSFDHQFRKVKARARELVGSMEGAPATPAKTKKSSAKTPNTSGKKRGE
jgi:hypothetical protein